MLSMKRLVAAMAIGSIFAAVYPAGLNAQAEKSAPAAAEAPAAAAAAPAAQKRPALRTTRESWTRADARVCLEFPTNLEIIKCAEKYRYTREPT